MGVACFLGDGDSPESKLRSEEEGRKWGGVSTRAWQEEKDIVLH